MPCVFGALETPTENVFEKLPHFLLKNLNRREQNKHSGLSTNPTIYQGGSRRRERKERERHLDGDKVAELPAVEEEVAELRDDVCAPKADRCCATVLSHNYACANILHAAQASISSLVAAGECRSVFTSITPIFVIFGSTQPVCTQVRYRCSCPRLRSHLQR